jgi:hypothetical protein
MKKPIAFYRALSRQHALGARTEDIEQPNLALLSRTRHEFTNYKPIQELLSGQHSYGYRLIRGFSLMGRAEDLQ